jgi:hypothetical protein
MPGICSFSSDLLGTSRTSSNLVPLRMPRFSEAFFYPNRSFVIAADASRERAAQMR